MRVLSLAILFFCFSTNFVVAKNLDQGLQSCLNNLLFKLNQSTTKDDLRLMFDEHTIFEELGANVYKGRTDGWHTFSIEMKQVGIDLFFDTLVSTSLKKGIGKEKRILSWLNEPSQSMQRSVFNGRGTVLLPQIEISLTDGVRPIRFALVMDEGCKIYDFIQTFSLAKQLTPESLRRAYGM